MKDRKVSQKKKKNWQLSASGDSFETALEAKFLRKFKRKISLKKWDTV